MTGSQRGGGAAVLAGSWVFGELLSPVDVPGIVLVGSALVMTSVRPEERSL
jgi:hypothetical protein